VVKARDFATPQFFPAQRPKLPIQLLVAIHFSVTRS
jgi:hypothetical protein